MATHSFEPVKIGLVGVGDFGRWHAITLAGLAEARLVALVDRNPDALKAIAAELPGVPTYTDLSQAVRDSGAEAWVVATPTRTHVAVATELLRAGKSVLLEKPVANSVAEATSLASLVKPDSANLMLGHIVLFSTEFRELQDQAQRRGPIKYLSFYRHRGTEHIAHFPGETPFHLTMVHDLYLAYALMGGAEPVAFSAQAHRSGDACDLALAQLQFASGAIATFAASFLCPPGLGFGGFDRLEAFGEGWAARVEANPRPVTLWDDSIRYPLGPDIRLDTTSPSGMLAEEHRCFCRVVRRREPVPMGATYHDAMRILAWLDRLAACSQRES